MAMRSNTGNFEIRELKSLGKLISSAENLIKENENYWAGYPDLYMPFKNLLFFGSDGGGDMFAFAIQEDGQIHNNDVYRWVHDDDSRTWFAGHLEQFFEFFLKGIPKIK